MDESIYNLIDRSALELTEEMDLLVTSLDGFYTREYRNDPSARGLSRFWTASARLPHFAEQAAQRHLDDFASESRKYRTAVDPLAPDAPETLAIAAQQLRTIVESLRLSAARRFRAALVSRSSIAPPVAGSLRVLNRAGQGVRSSEAIYLVARKALIDHFNESQLSGLLAAGQATATVVHRDPEHEMHGRAIAIDRSITDLPHYEDVESTWFHPRSSALIDRSN